MIVIEPVGTLPEGSRQPGKIQLPVLIPPSPEGSDRQIPERKKSFWFFALIGGIFAAVALSGSESTNGQKTGKASRPAPTPKTPPFSGRIANCAIWIPDRRGGWTCGAYGRVCDSPSCAKPTRKDSRQARVCVKTQKVFSKFLKKKVSRCKRYEATCTGPACMDFTMPYPEGESERTTPRDDEVKLHAEWMAEQYNEEHFERIPYLAREILDRGGIRPPRTPYGLEPPKKQVDEYTMIPLFLRNKTGKPCDEMAALMGYEYCDDLREDILKAYPQKTKGAWKKITRKTWRDFEDDARWEIEEKMRAGEWIGLARARTNGFGQDLFPQLKRELRFDPPEDIATSDDPVIACMQRLGWKLPRIEELKASIAEKMTPDLFTMKIKPLSPGEKEYQRVVGECLEQRSGTA